MDYNRDKEAKPIEGKPEKHIEKVVTGKVIQKPKKLGTRFRSIFLGADTDMLRQYITYDVVMPWVRNFFWEILDKGGNRFIYGEGSRRRPNVYGPGPGRFQYNSILDQRNPPPTPGMMGPRDMGGLTGYRPSTYRTGKRQIEDIILISREECERVIESLNDVIDKYGVVSLADMYEFLGLEASPIDNKWGWTYLKNATSRQTREGYILDLPAVEEIQ